MRTSGVLVLALFVLAGCMDASGPRNVTPAPQAATEEPNEACLEFVVFDEELAPIPGANVSVDELNVVVATDAVGQAKVCELPNGSYHVAVMAKGYDTSRKTVSYPAEALIKFTLRLLPVLVPYSEVLPKALFHTVSFSTLDATVSRVVSLNDVACSPCSFDFVTPEMPDFVYWEAVWTRSAMVLPAEDQMHHIFRGGAPFENAPGDTSDRDIGSGAMTQPFHFQYHRNDMVQTESVAEAEKAGGEVAFSGAMYCWGNPPSPCLNQRIDVYLTVWYNILKVPEGYTALPPTS